MKLIPKTHKAKNRIHEAGTDEVKVLAERENVLFDPGKGPWLHVAFVGARSKHSRWVHATQDPDFEVVDLFMICKLNQQ